MSGAPTHWLISTQVAILGALHVNGVARPAAIYKSLVKNICSRRRCEARDRDPGKRASMYLQPAGHVATCVEINQCVGCTR